MKELLTIDHQEVDAILGQLFAAFERKDLAEIRRHLDLFWARLAMHIRAENLHLFPAVLRAARELPESGLQPEVIERSILNLDDDHNFFMRELGSAVKELFDMGEVDPSDQAEELTALCERINALAARLERHNQQEEAGVYEWAESLSIEEITALDARIRRELTNLPPRFKGS